MWASWVIAGIAFTGTAFMLRFLMALLREGAPSVCYWVTPGRREARIGKHPDVLRGICFDEECAAEGSRPFSAELLEVENYAKQECDSDLIALRGWHVRPVFERVEWRSVHPSRGYIFRERRL